MSNDVVSSTYDMVPLHNVIQVRQVTWCSMAVVVSQEPEFLTAFAEWSLKGRLLVWSTRLVVVTRLLLPQLQALLPTYWTFSMMNTVFLNVEKKSSIITVTMPDYGESFLKYFRRSNSPLFIALGNLMELGPNAVEGLQRALRAKEAHVSGRRYLKYQVADKFGNEDGTNRLYVGRETVFPGHSGWPIPHDAPYSEQLDNSIMAVLEAGLYEKWTSDILAKTIMERKRRLRQPQQGDHQKDSAPKKSSQSLTITHTQGAFILLLLGLILSTITFAAEMKFP
ncbi:hypothetical protein E2C01_011059 [Portunus trituberculatus]|uniref:Uncharacterized protein n=1 Tax=Portunus trituberculatus TaxID=210409 RepID=A0A5B7DAD8_PORTR|nr:hypothetical protein [Portunus trituberculatus]